MGKNNNIIEINGKRYDARTGVMLSPHSHENILEPASVASINPGVNAKSMHDVVRKPAKSVYGHKPIPSKTLMRHAVKKPTVDHSKPKIKAQGPSDIALKDTLASVEVKKSVKSVDHAKLAKAKHVTKSHLIAHFGDITSDTNSSKVSPDPHPAPVTPAASAKLATQKNKSKTTADLLEHAIQQANSHKEPAPKLKKRRKGPRMALASMTAVLLLAFVGYQEIPKLQFNLAAAKAGFGASLPDYQPPGYSVGKLSYSPGVIATKFSSNSDQRGYTLTQKTSSWNSQALKDNFILHTTDKYQVVETGGRTIYLYGNGNASWVNGGIWYIIQSNGSLSNDQLVDVAKSI